MEPIVKLEVCISNLDLGSQEVWDQVKAAFPEVRLIRWGCMGYCHRCIRVPYVLLNDSEYLEAGSAEELFQIVCERIQSPSQQRD